MFFPVNLTLIRGRSGVPITFLRTRQWRRRPKSCFFSGLISIRHGFCRESLSFIQSLLHRLAFLADHMLAQITDALAFVRLRRIEAADFSRDLADDFFARAFNGELRVFLDG